FNALGDRSATPVLHFGPSGGRERSPGIAVCGPTGGSVRGTLPSSWGTRPRGRPHRGMVRGPPVLRLRRPGGRLRSPGASQSVPRGGLDPPPFCQIGGREGRKRRTRSARPRNPEDGTGGPGGWNRSPGVTAPIPPGDEDGEPLCGVGRPGVRIRSLPTAAPAALGFGDGGRVGETRRTRGSMPGLVVRGIGEQGQLSREQRVRRLCMCRSCDEAPHLLYGTDARGGESPFQPTTEPPPSAPPSPPDRPFYRRRGRRGRSPCPSPW